MGSWFDVLMLFALIVFNGVFSMSEIALVTSRKARLQVMAEDGNKGAQRAALRAGWRKAVDRARGWAEE